MTTARGSAHVRGATSLRAALVLSAFALSACCRIGSCGSSGSLGGASRRVDGGAPSGPPSSAGGAPSGAPIVALAPGSDAAPSAYTTLAESAEKRPSWWVGRRPLEAPGGSSFAALEAALVPARPGALTNGFVACTVRYGAATDAIPFREGADLYGTLRLGARSLSFSGASVSAPLVKLAVGDRVAVSARDSDILFDDDLGAATTTYAGVVPFEAKRGHLTLRCGALEPARLEPVVAEHLRLADRAIDKAVRGLRFDRDAWDWGAKLSGLPDAESAIDDVAALVGFADPRVERRVDWLERARARLEAEAIPIVEELRRAAASEVTIGAPKLGAVSFERAVCDPAEVSAWLRANPALRTREPLVRCLVRVKITAGTEAWNPPFASIYGAVLSARGAVRILEVGPLEGATRPPPFAQIAPGRTATQVLYTRRDLLAPGDEALVLRVVFDGKRHYLRMR
jgi:hypothetical protein